MVPTKGNTGEDVISSKNNKCTVTQSTKIRKLTEDKKKRSFCSWSHSPDSEDFVSVFNKRPKKKGTTVPSVQSEPAVTEGEEAEEATTCIVCAEPWTLTGARRVTILKKCGHLFCEMCLRTILRNKQKEKHTCPTCREKFSSRSLVHIHVAKVTAVDNSSLQAAQNRALDFERKLQEEQRAKKMLEARCTVLERRLTTLQGEHTRLKELIQGTIGVSASSMTPTFEACESTSTNTLPLMRDKLASTDPLVAKPFTFTSAHPSPATPAATSSAPSDIISHLDSFNLAGCEAGCQSGSPTKRSSCPPPQGIQEICSGQSRKSYVNLSADPNVARDAGKTEQLLEQELFKLETQIALKGARVFDFDWGSDSLLISATGSSGGQHGLRRVLAMDPTHTEFWPLHQEAIRDVRLSPAGDYTLTASMDKSARLVSTKSGNVVASFPLQNQAWSCGWSTDNDNIFFIGTNKGEVLLYDIRSGSSAPYHLLTLPARTPVHSLTYIPSIAEIDAASSSLSATAQGVNQHGLLTGTSTGLVFWNDTSLQGNKVIDTEGNKETGAVNACPAPATGPSAVFPFRDCVSSWYDAPSRRVLASLRSRGDTQACHVVSELHILQNDRQRSSPALPGEAGSTCDGAFQASSSKCTLRGHQSFKVMARSCLFTLPRSGSVDHAETRSMVASGDAATKQLWLWDCHSGTVHSRLAAHARAITDVRYCSHSQRLGSLSSDRIILYRLR